MPQSDVTLTTATATATPTLPPTDPISAVTHPAPYDYYDRLATRPMYRDLNLQMWVAASADDVDTVLSNRAARVRPRDLPVPAHLAGTAAGDLFARLVRMNDGPRSAAVKTSLESVVAGLQTGDVDRFCSESLAASDVRGEAGDLGWIDWLMHGYPTTVIARVIGVGPAGAAHLVGAARTLAAAFGPGTCTLDSSEIDAAAATLLDAAGREGRIGAGTDRRRPAATMLDNSLASLLAASLGSASAADARANIAGLFFQNFDAMAGLIGNTLARQARSGRVPDDLATARTAINDTLWFDPPIHNTRRYVHERVRIGHCELAAGDTVLLVLAAANRDPAAERPASFGSGAHLCPARSLAPQIAAHAVAAVGQRRSAIGPRLAVSGYRRSPNARIPLFTAADANTAPGSTPSPEARALLM